MKHSNIQWCHSSINPVMGCLDECELANKDATVAQLIRAMAKLIPHVHDQDLVEHVRTLLKDKYLSEIYQEREELAGKLLEPYGPSSSDATHQVLVDAIRKRSKCYAMLLGVNRAGHKGYADKFEEPKLFPGRMAEAAKWGPPSDAERASKPWLGERRAIFISDMGDSLSRSIPFEFLETEVIQNVTSESGSRHLWLWLTKQPRRMAKFADWLLKRGIAWPENLIAMTTVTSAKTLGRINELLKVPSRFKGLSVEPLFGPVTLPLTGIDWVIVGGGSDVLAEPFHVEWALDVLDQCEKASCAFFLKQLGKHPFYENQPLKLRHPHGGNLSEWPEACRVRQILTVFDGPV